MPIERVDGERVNAEQLHAELVAIALAGEGWPAILRRLSDATGRVARIVAVHGGLLATSEDAVTPAAASVPASGVPASDSTELGVDPAAVRAALARDDVVPIACTDGTAARAVAVHAGRRRIGLLLLADPVDHGREAMLLAAVVPVAIEAVRRDADAAATAESASRLVDELRFGSLRDTEQLQHAARRFGLHLDRPHAAAVFEYDGDNRRTWSTAIRWIEMPVREDGGLGWTVLTDDIGAQLHRIRDRLEGIVGDGPVIAATGPTVSDVAATARSFREAEVVLALLRRRAPEVELPYEHLGLSALLLDVAPDRLRTFVDAQLGPLLGRPDLLDTLAAWYDANGSRAGVAERLQIHRNSVGYRIGRIREVLGTDPLAPANARRLQAALDAHEVVAAMTDLGRVTGKQPSAR